MYYYASPALSFLVQKFNHAQHFIKLIGILLKHHDFLGLFYLHLIVHSELLDA